MTEYHRIKTEPKFDNLEEFNLIVYRIYPSLIPKGEELHIYFTEILKNGQQENKIKFLRLAEEALTQLSKMRGPVETFSEVLRSIVEDKGIYEYQYGIFFMLYAQFQQKHKIEDDREEQKQTTEKMQELLEGNQTMFKNYKRGDREMKVPLPIYIRNAIAHHGTNKANTFTPQELKASIDFLRESISEGKTKARSTGSQHSGDRLN